MIGDGIHEDALRYLVQQHAVREAIVGCINGGPAWGLSIRLGAVQPHGWCRCAHGAKRCAPEPA